MNLLLFSFYIQNSFANFAVPLVILILKTKMSSRKSRRFHHSQTEGRINFTSSKYLSKVKTFLGIFVLVMVFIISFIIITKGITYLTLIASALSAISAYIFLSYIYSHTHSAALKGDTLILNSMDHKSLVMSVSSVKEIKSRCVMGICWTSIKYIFDGKRGWVFIITNNLTTSPEQSVSDAIELKEENKKANHKPGSVITQQA